jgi:hypothetical protein
MNPGMTNRALQRVTATLGRAQLQDASTLSAATRGLKNKQTAKKNK